MSHRRRLRQSTMLAGGFAAALLFAAPALAQDAQTAPPQDPDEDATTLGEVVVTGTRIRVPD